MIGVYAVINIANNRAYVGSSTNVKKRLIAHKSAIKTGNCIHYQGYAEDAKKYGVFAFDFKVLKETKTIEEARELEESFLGLFLDNLYNITESAQGGGPKQRQNIQPYITGAAKRLSDPEYRKKLSIACKGKREIVTCPHCQIKGGGGNMRRYHFDNCKGKP
jgi:group I intron endonuclease